MNAARFTLRQVRSAVLAVSLGVGLAAPVAGQEATTAQVTPFMQGVAESASSDREIAAFYRDRAYRPIWTGTGEMDRRRRQALFTALSRAGDHALPVAKYDVDLLAANLRSVESARALGTIEVELSRLFVEYANDVHSGVLTPRRVDSGIVRDLPRKSAAELLDTIAETDTPTMFLRSLPPKAPEYGRLIRAKMRLESQLARGGWGPTVPVRALRPGQSGPAVVALRNRLIAMGYLERTPSSTYDAALETAVRQFQIDNGLEGDGVAGPGTIAEINTPIEERLPGILVAIERERWMNVPRGARHVWVNLTDFTAAIVDNGDVTFKTRSVIGKNVSDRRSPEFSDVMEYMEINPYWNVPRSIAVNEYLPRMIASGGGAAGHLQLVDARRNVVSRGRVNWSRYSARNFPFDLRQPPGAGNALGRVKFMFPNRYNIYLHDTPAKSLFRQEVRAFSHGCIRLNDPYDFAYAILARQTDRPREFFHRILDSWQNTQVRLDQPIPVHIVYRTAFTSPKGRLNFRDDVYGRDAKIYDALRRAGVALGGVQS